MNARWILFATLGAMALLVGALLFAVGGDDAGISAAPARNGAPAAERPQAAPDSGRLDQLADTLPEAAAPVGGTREPAGGGTAPPASRSRDGGEGPASSASGASSPAAGGPGSDVSAPADGAGTEPRSAQQDVAEILRATARRYEGVRALQADFRQELTNTLLGRTTRSAGTLYQRQPDRFLMRFSDPAGDVIVSDGEYFWIYYPSADPKQVIRSSRGAGGLDLRSQFVGDPVRRFESTYHGTEAVGGREAHVLTLVPREAVGYRRLKAWIDAGDHLVRRFELTEENGNVRRFELSDLRINPQLPDSLFRFQPPAGAVVVSR